MRCDLSGAESLVDGFGGLYRSSIDAPVEEEHDEHGNEETAQGRVDDVARIVGQLAGPVLAVLHGRRSVGDLTVVPAHQGREADEEAEEPDDGQQDLGPPRGHDRRIGHWASHGQIAVQGDGAQVQNGRRAHPHVDGQPDRAPDLAEDPHVEHFERGTERQDGQTHRQVGHGQTHDEQVGHRPQPLVEEHGQDHQTVAQQDQDVHGAQDHQRQDETRLRPVHLVQRVAAVVVTGTGTQ